MEREITLSSFPVQNTGNNRPGDFTTRFSPEKKVIKTHPTILLLIESSPWLLPGPILTLDMLTKR